MRRLLSLLILPILVLPALAEEPLKAEARSPSHAPQTWEQHFAQANLAHDGHLTPEESKGGYPLIAKHFNDIDIDHKGFVTENDIRAWRVMRKAAHRLTRPPEDGLKPRNAFQRQYPDHRPPVPARMAAL